MKNTLTPFGRRVRVILMDRGMTVGELSEKIGCRPNYLSMMLRGVKPVNTHYNARIRAALAMDTVTEQDKGA